jgi:hypothetical protein
MALLAIERQRAVEHDRRAAVVYACGVMTLLASRGGMRPQKRKTARPVVIEIRRGFESHPAVTSVAGSGIPSPGELATVGIVMALRALTLGRKHQRIRSLSTWGIIGGPHVLVAFTALNGAVTILEWEPEF